MLPYRPLLGPAASCRWERAAGLGVSAASCWRGRAGGTAFLIHSDGGTVQSLDQ